MKKRLKQIYNHFGYRNQNKKIIEESYELAEAIIDFKNKAINSKEQVENIKEELADVMILLNQVAIEFNIPNSEIENIMEEKIERTEERIKSGYYK